MDTDDQGEVHYYQKYVPSWYEQEVKTLPFFDGEDVGIYAGVGDKLYKIIGDDCTEVKDA